MARVSDKTPGALDGATLVGPAIEGVGMYPLVSKDLGVSLPRVWVAGDAAGAFRGLTAAMISGYSAGLMTRWWLTWMLL